MLMWVLPLIFSDSNTINNLYAMRRKNNRDSGLTGVLFPPSSDWEVPTSFPNLAGVRKLAIDIESCDPHLTTRGPGFIRGDARVTGIAIATDDRGWYLPFGHLGGGNMDRDSVVAFTKDALSCPDTWIVGANLSYELDGLASLGIKVAGRLLDIQLIEALIDEERDTGYSLDELCKSYLGTGKDEALLRDASSTYGVDPKSELWKLPSRYVGAYASYDAFCCHGILEKQMERVKADDLTQIVELEMRLIKVLHKMRMLGITIDLNKASDLSKRLVVEEDALRIKMIREYGSDINTSSSQQIAKVCDKLKISYPRTAKTGVPSFEAKWLDEHDHPFIELVQEIRQMVSLRTKFIDSWIFENHVNGIVHPSWKQLMSDDGGTRTGRMAASNPNPQQIPAGKRRNGEPNLIGAEIRSLFRPLPGCRWGKYDYSQQEPRILTHFAEVCSMTGASAAGFAYRSNPNMDFYQFMVEIAQINRRTAKDMYLGRCYGMGKNKLAMKLNRSIPECEAILKNFDEKVPFVKEMADKCMQLADARGYVKTLCGRRRHFNYWELSWQDKERLKRAGGYPDLRPRLLPEAQEKWRGYRLVRAHTHKALNAVIQGSAADMMKCGLIELDTIGITPHITVHDEVGVSIDSDEMAYDVKMTMETCVDMVVPINSDMSLGESWR